MSAIIPTFDQLWDGATLPDVHCAPCEAGQHPADGCDAMVTVLDTATNVHVMACDCEPCHEAYNRAYWGAVS